MAEDLQSISSKLDVFQNLLLQLVYKVDIMANELQALQAQVAASISAEQSAITLLQGISTALNNALASLAASGSPQQLNDLSASLQASQAALAAAITANTPAAGK